MSGHVPLAILVALFLSVTTSALIFRQQIFDYVEQVSLRSKFTLREGPESRELNSGDTFRDCITPDVCPEMTVLPPGRFLMGARVEFPEPEPEELPPAIIDIDYRLAVSTFEITQSQWRTCETLIAIETGITCPIRTKNTLPSDLPIDSVSWEDAQIYVNWLNVVLGLPPKKGYRLLSEAEWEYSVRGETKPDWGVRLYFWGNRTSDTCRYANVATEKTQEQNVFVSWPVVTECEDGSVEPSTVGSYIPNGFGLYDMAGNLTEWVQDCWHENYDAPSRPKDGRAWTVDAPANCERVLRGGSWSGQIDKLRNAARSHAPMSASGSNIGFRVARTISLNIEN